MHMMWTIILRIIIRQRKYNMTQESQIQKIYKSVETTSCLVYKANPCSWAKHPKMALCSAPSLRRREDSSLDHLRYRDPKELSEWNILKWAQLKPLDQPSQFLSILSSIGDSIGMFSCTLSQKTQFAPAINSMRTSITRTSTKFAISKALLSDQTIHTQTKHHHHHIRIIQSFESCMTVTLIFTAS